jgi:hypothetical protein
METDIYFVLSDLLNESLMNKEDSGKQLYEKVKELLLKQQQSEPFSELPESIRIHIENVSSQFNENGNETLRPLVSSIRDTIIEAERKAEAQRLYTKYSCLVGIISLLIGIASLIFAINKIRSEANTEIPNNINIQSDSNASLPE